MWAKMGKRRFRGRGEGGSNSESSTEENKEKTKNLPYARPSNCDIEYSLGPHHPLVLDEVVVVVSSVF